MPILSMSVNVGVLEGTIKDNSMGIVVVNTEKRSDRNVRIQLRSCILGEEGSFDKPFEITLYTDSSDVEKYRLIKSRIEDWGGKCTLKKEDEETIFEFRSLGALPLYLWNGRSDDIYEAFLSKNVSFYSTGYDDLGYDEFFANGQFEVCQTLLEDNINIIVT